MEKTKDDNKQRAKVTRLRKPAGKMKQIIEPIANWEDEGGATLPTGEIPIGQEIQTLLSPVPATLPAQNETAASDIQAKRNSPEQSSPDVKAQGWSAEKLAEQSVYEDETLMKAQMKAGKQAVAGK